ncbi:hypothetical protein GWK47_027918 [Chionoecetes opilio]|uniref:Uncharacterized protein n=1 Tax=Chionoecetes opilio TaxID=41210 RepID=A0A8J5D3S1_CHIOP|nr:hypothetical protein GWK47_027918 [Chionoecetes opilio]
MFPACGGHGGSFVCQNWEEEHTTTSSASREKLTGDCLTVNDEAPGGCLERAAGEKRRPATSTVSAARRSGRHRTGKTARVKEAQECPFSVLIENEFHLELPDNARLSLRRTFLQKLAMGL